MLLKKSLPIIILLFLIFVNPIYAAEGIEMNNNSQSAIVMERETGRILYEKNIHQKMPMASTTKIMTALLAIENIPLDKKVTVHPQSQGIEGSSIYLRANEKMKMIDLLYGLMLRSGNDSAVAIAYEVAGSVENFADLMNKKAKELGAYNTNFKNPHGLHDDEHYTTAYDLALITREALKNPAFREIVKTKFWVADREGYKHFANKNDLLHSCDGGDGVKTGYTMRSGRCLVASATRNNMQLIAITLNDYDWFNTTKALLDKSFDVFIPYQLFTENQKIVEIEVKNGVKPNIKAVSTKSVLLPLHEGEEKKLISVFDIPETLTAPIEKGQRIGKITTYLNGKMLNSTNLVAQESIEKETFKDKVLKFFKIK